MASSAPRYASALADVVEQENLDYEQVRRQLEDFSTAFAESRELRETLLNPAFPVDRRVAILDAVNRRIQLGPKLRNFVAVLIENGRLAELDEILEQYRAETDRRRGVSEAEITSARPLEDAQRAEVERQVAALAGTAVRASYREDPSLVGGVIVRVGSTVYDGSVKGRLERLKERLASS
ncbi:MAG TPA: ATP synthase F1 subunit delta [Acidobacteriaceae bacterium]|nr:ATP synthase F1 subunit delta [Acidobacteriaceae bacterium]